MATKKGFKSSARSKRKASRKKIEYKKKEFRYRGYSLEDLQKLSVEEILPLLPSRTRRTLKRGLTQRQNKLIDDIEKAQHGDTIKTHCRNMVILPNFVGHVINIHNGKEFQRLTIEPQMIGHYLGEYTITNKPVRHGQPGIGASRSSMYVPLK
jgi:small subunit ribosomal protein S19